MHALTDPLLEYLGKPDWFAQLDQIVLWGLLVSALMGRKLWVLMGLSLYVLSDEVGMVTGSTVLPGVFLGAVCIFSAEAN